MAFDPDAYLAEKQSAAFDPDAYLASKVPAAPAGPRQMTTGEQLLNNPITKGAYGLAEAGTNMLTGIGASAVGGAKGIYDLATGKGLDQAVKSIRGIQEAGTYEPRTAEGAAATEIAALPVELASKGTKFVGGHYGQKYGGEQGQLIGESIGEKLPEVVGTLYGGRGGLRKARERSATDTAAATYPDRQTPTQIKQAVDNAASVEAAQAGQKYGVALDLTQLDKSTALRNIAGPKKTQEAMSAVNAGKPEMALKQEVGIEPQVKLDHSVLDTNLERLAVPKNEIVGMDGFLDDGTAAAQMRATTPQRTLGMSKEHAAAANEIETIVKELETNVGGGTGQWVMKSIEDLRQGARDKLKTTGEITKQNRDLSRIYQKAADALEGIIERRLATENPQLLDAYRTNRQKMAQTYLLKDIVDNNTGKVDLTKLADMTSGDSNITGAFKDFGKMYAHSPESFKPIPKESWGTRITRSTVPGAIGSVLGSMVAPGAGTLAGMAGGAYLGRYLGNRAATRLASPEYQAKYTALRGDPSRTALGYGEAPAPLSMAPAGENIPGLPQAAGQAPRTPLDIGFAEAPADMATQALRTRHDVPTNEFTLRQDFLQQPEIVAATDAFRSQIAELEALKNKQSGFWKEKTQTQIDALKQEFAAGLRQLGVDTPQQAIGLQNLYEGGVTPKLSVEKSFDPRPPFVGPVLPGKAYVDRLRQPTLAPPLEE